ncbi:MAG TPA: hypothetical protein VNK43_08835 [Gemmatimonadales bacterium]|nr:hypothetical protein [Gemmatimonadales bacterium]
MDGLRHRFCIRFLVDSTVAAKQLPDGFVPVRATAADSLHPALRRAAEEQPDAVWVASALCVSVSEGITVGERRFADRDLEDLQGLASWTIDAAPAEGGPPRRVALSLLTTNWRVNKAAEPAFVKAREFRWSAKPDPERPDDRYQLRLDGTTLTWDGRLTGDSIPVASTIDEQWVMDGNRRTRFEVRHTLRPTYQRGMAGSLRVEGKDALAKALKGSPIRFVGPMYFGGVGELVFTR